MVLSRSSKVGVIREQSERFVRADLSPILASGPPTHAAIGALQAPDLLRIPFYRSGFHRVPSCNNPDAKSLNRLLKAFRTDSIKMRFKATETMFREPGMLSRKKMVGHLEKLDRSLHELCGEQSSPELAEAIGPLREVLSESLLFCKSRPRKTVQRYYTDLIRSILERGFLSVYYLEHKTQWESAPDPSLKERADRLKEVLRTNSAHIRNIKGIVDLPPSDNKNIHFRRAVDYLYKELKMSGPRPKQAPYGPLVKNMARFYNAHQEACIYIFAEAVESFKNNQNPDTFNKFLQAGEILQATVLPFFSLASNPFTIPIHQVSGLAEDMKMILGSKFVEMKPTDSEPEKGARSFKELMIESLRWQAWCTPFVHSFSKKDTQDFLNGPKRYRDILRRADAAIGCVDLGGWLNFRYRGGDPSPWQRFSRMSKGIDPPSRLGELVLKILARIHPEGEKLYSPEGRLRRGLTKLLPKVVNAIEGANSDFRKDGRYYKPSADQVVMMQFGGTVKRLVTELGEEEHNRSVEKEDLKSKKEKKKKSLKVEVPGSVIKDVVKLQNELSRGLEAYDPSQMQAGLITSIDEEELKKRVKKHDASILCLKRNEELLAAYVLCSNQECLPDLGTELREMLIRQKMLDPSPGSEVPVVLCDLAIKKPGSEFLIRSHGEDPYRAINNLRTGMIQAAFPFAETVFCVGICRENNPALKAHLRLGSKILPGETYVDDKGISHHVLYQILKPAYDLI